MKRAFLILSIAALALPAAALGKGPTAASIDGPGSSGGIRFTGCCTPESPTMTLAEQAGFFPAVFADVPDPMLDARPKGDLGPKYTITYTVPGPNNETWKIQQDAYPYASPGPVTYMEPGQEVFEIVGGTRGGWFQADARLKETLVSAGRPARSPAPSSETSTGATNLLVLLITILLVTGAATAVGLRSIGRWPFPSRSTSTT